MAYTPQSVANKPASAYIAPGTPAQSASPAPPAAPVAMAPKTTGYTPSSGAASVAQRGLSLSGSLPQAPALSQPPAPVAYRPAVQPNIQPVQQAYTPQVQPNTQPQPSYTLPGQFSPVPNTSIQSPIQGQQAPTPQPVQPQPAQPQPAQPQQQSGINPEALKQVSDYVTQLSQVQPQDYANMSPEQLTESIKGSANALNQTIGQMGNLVNVAVNAQTPDVHGIISDYMGQINSFLDQYVQQAQDAYNNGMNDPGLLQALTVLRDQAAVQKQQLDEDLNARGLSQSGIWAENTQQFYKNAQGQEATVISAHLSQITATLQNALQSVLNQRVAALTQFAGIASEAEMQAAQLQLQQLSTALSGLNSIMQTQAGETQSLRNYDMDKQQLTESTRQADQQLQLEQAKLAEMIRSNQADEAIQRQQLAVQRAAADAQDALNAMDAQKYAMILATQIQELAKNGDPVDIMNNPDKYKAMLGVIPGNQQQETMFQQFLKETEQAWKNTRSDITPTHYASDNYAGTGTGIVTWEAAPDQTPWQKFKNWLP